MKHLSLLPLLALMALPLSAQTTLTDADLENAYTTRSYSHRISCHDPSIVMDNITDPSNPVFYVYGSHLGHGSTTAASNYQDWDQSWGAFEVAGTANSLFANANGDLINYSDAYGNAHSWQYSGNNVQGMQWAPDIIYNPTMKKWCLYESLNGDYWCSSIVLFTSDSPKGPWVNKGVVVYSGFSGRFDHNGYTKSNDYKQTDLEKVLGTQASLPSRYNIAQSSRTSWGNVYPNNIDPCVFYDDDNNLWMSYGSWSGGIFMLKLDPATGLRDYTQKYDYRTQGVTSTIGRDYNVLSDPYFGKKIAGGYYVSGEGSYIQKIGNYYFLFMSYGGLNPSQGYQMRVFRSQNPDGPYVDANGTSAIYNSYAMNYGSGATDNRGVLLMDGYQWETMPKGEVAQGHNSAFVDDKGRAFVVYHTKFNDGTFGHEVRVHQLFLNEDGWLMAAPYEFNGETVTNDQIASTASISDADIPGDYQFIRHQYDQSHAKVSSSSEATTAKLASPVDIKLSADGRVTGTGISNGTWTRKAGTDFITLSLSGVNYKGVLVKETIDYTNIPAICIAAVSDDSGNNGRGAGAQTRQQEIWASKADAKAAIKYTLDRTQLPIQDGATINTDVALPETGYLGTKITWTSSDMNVFDADFGEITGKGPVVLTMTVSKDNTTYSKEFRLNVDKDAQASTPVYYPVSSEKNLTSAWWTNFTTQYYTIKKGNAAEFKFYNYGDEAENWDNWCLVAANNERGAAGYSEYFVIRNDNYGWGNDHNAVNLSCDYNWNTFKSDMNGSLVDMTCSYGNDGKLTMTSKITTKAGKVYNYSYSANLTGSPAQVTLFFVNEKSYIDGSAIETGISSIITGRKKVSDNRIFNLNGQEVDKSYRGVVIKNGRKVLQH